MSLPISDDAVSTDASISLAPLAGVLDKLDHGVVLLASDLDECFTNAAAERMLGADAERGVISREMRSVYRVAVMHDGRPAEAEVATRKARYRMRATMLRYRIQELRSRAVLVTIVRASAELPSRERLMHRFRMTAREADVALLLARGRRNTAIAEELAISVHTARHHTESVLSKLDVHARSEVSRVIDEGVVPDHRDWPRRAQIGE